MEKYIVNFCTNCGKERIENRELCFHCGYSFKESISKTKTNVPSIEYVPNYLAFAIVNTILFCFPAGIVAIVYASQVNSKLSYGDVEGAKYSSKRARIWCWVSLGSVLFIFLIALIVTALQ